MKFDISRTSAWSGGSPMVDDRVKLEKRIGTRGNTYEVYTIEVNTLDELLELTKDEPEIIIINHGEGMYEIELYDTYRE